MPTVSLNTSQTSGSSMIICRVRVQSRLSKPTRRQASAQTNVHTQRIPSRDLSHSIAATDVPDLRTAFGAAHITSLVNKVECGKVFLCKSGQAAALHTYSPRATASNASARSACTVAAIRRKLSPHPRMGESTYTNTVTLPPRHAPLRDSSSPQLLPATQCMIRRRPVPMRDSFIEQLLLATQTQDPRARLPQSVANSATTPKDGRLGGSTIGIIDVQIWLLT